MSTRRIVLGVTGSIAAYKAAELVRLVKRAGLEVDVILTRAGAEFITPLTLATLSGTPVTVDHFGAPIGPSVGWNDPSEGAREASGPSPKELPSSAPPPASGIWHIQASRQASLLVVAPATGNIIGKVAQGIADDALSTTLMASSAPVLFAPAMNTLMWQHPAVVENVRLLKARGCHFVEPGAGELACGEVGDGRMAEPEQILARILDLLPGRGEKGRLLVTAGGTVEPLDPVRCLTNHSSGRMGFAIAEAGRDFGYDVTLIRGRTSVAPPSGVKIVPVETAEEMKRAVERHHASHDLLIMAAAVADYRPRKKASQKLPSGQSSLRLELVPTPDILASLNGKRSGKVTIGFALETGNGRGQRLDNARRKLAEKGCDLIVLNDPLIPGSEFGSETSTVTFVYPGGRVEELSQRAKYEVAAELLKRAEALRSSSEPKIVRKPSKGRVPSRRAVPPPKARSRRGARGQA